jgi:hypothetical protein
MMSDVPQLSIFRKIQYVSSIAYDLVVNATTTSTNTAAYDYLLLPFPMA